jgi:hypothetical protein
VEDAPPVQQSVNANPHEHSDGVHGDEPAKFFPSSEPRGGGFNFFCIALSECS